MAYQVKPTRSAATDINEAFVHIGKDSINAAATWLAELSLLLNSLSNMPARFASVPERSLARRGLRHVIHYSHRVIYRIDESNRTVFVMRVYHTARRPLRPSDLEV